MGRHPKELGVIQGLDRRESGYYSTPRAVAAFLSKRLLILNPKGRQVLDPCTGQGELLWPFLERRIKARAFDILEFSLPAEVAFERRDFLDWYADLTTDCILGRQIELPYDFYVANPPYNCHEVDYIRRNKSRLDRLFGAVGAHNMYSMFISALIDCARDGALLGLITLDSFLTARCHEPLRAKLLRECSLHDLILCPNELFRSQGADVRTVILVLQKGTQYQGLVRCANREPSVSSFTKLLENDQFQTVPLESIVLSGEKDRREIVLDVPPEIRSLLGSARLDDQFECATGISTGNDREYLSKSRKAGFSVPFYKNPASRRFYTAPNNFLRDDFLELGNTVKNFTVRNKRLLYKAGITCSSMGAPFSACYLPPGCAFGVNANVICPPRDTWWLLAYLNSHLVTYLVRGILNRSNMVTAGYIARIPLPKLACSTKHRLAKLAQSAFKHAQQGERFEREMTEINSLTSNELGLSRDTEARIKYFAEHILKAL